MDDTQLLQEVKDYLRIDGSENDLILVPLIMAGKDFIKGATGKEFSFQPLEITCLKMLMLHWYDSELKTIPFGVQSILRHIELQ